MKNIAEIKNLNVTYNTKKGLWGKHKTIYALNGINLDIKRGEILAIAGESGCGKSTLAKSIMLLTKTNSGEIIINGIDILKLKRHKDLQKYYQQVQIIFQNPYASLNPKMKIKEILAEPLQINTKYKKQEIEKIIQEKISKVGLETSCLERYPHEFSGGQRQRIAIARSLILEPEFIIADEPVSALDVSIQAQIINLLKDLQAEFNLTFLFISHDLSVIRHLSDRIAIMYLGEVVEIGNKDEIFNNTKHPYTKALISAVPQIEKKDKEDQIELKGELPNPEDLPNGCKFHTRCPYAMEICKTQQPNDIKFSDTHTCKCFLYSV